MQETYFVVEVKEIFVPTSLNVFLLGKQVQRSERRKGIASLRGRIGQVERGRDR